MLGRLTSYVHDQKGKLLEIVFEQLYCDTSTTESVLSEREISKIQFTFRHQTNFRKQLIQCIRYTQVSENHRNQP